MDKKRYKVTFYAEMDDNDIQAMNKYFYETMGDQMEICSCEGLKIEPEKMQSENNDGFGIDHSISLGLEAEGDVWEFDSRTGDVWVSEEVFNDPVELHDHVQAYFRDDDLMEIYTVEEFNENNGSVKLAFLKAKN